MIKIDTEWFVPDSKDLQLALSAAEGDTQAFEELVNIYYKGIVGACYSIVLNKQDAEDCAQETFIKAYKNIRRYHAGSSFFTWIYRIAINTCYDLLRKNKRSLTISIDEPFKGQDGDHVMQIADSNIPIDDEIINRISDKTVHQILSQIPEKYSRILRMKDIDNLNYKQISKIEKIKLGTVKSRLSRAREIFAKHAKKVDLYVD
jgi:RNA polymerase sigma-70 factor, ECF subfamily